MAPRTLGRWALVLVAGAALLAGRYDFREAGGKYALEAWVSSLYFLLIAVPFTWALTRRLWGEKPALVATGIVLALHCLPYKLLGLGGLRYDVHHVSYTQRTPSEIVWFPRALFEPAAGEGWLLLGFVALVAAVAYALTRDWRKSAPFVVMAALIALQAFLHTSLRSPYSYEAHLEKAGKWYHNYLLPDGQAAVNADAPFFTGLDDHFNGLPRTISLLLIRRSFLHWLGSPLTFFFNPYYVYLFLNCVLWLVAALCAYGFIRRVTESEEAARIVGALVLVSNGFIHFVAQPTSYLASFAMIPIALWSFERLLVERQELADTLVYGVLLGLCAATYDFVPFFPMLLGYAAYRRAAMKHIGIALAIAAALPWGFLFVQFQILRLQGASNTYFITNAARNWLHLLMHPSASVYYEKLSHLPMVLLTDLVYAFALLAPVAALVGVLVKSERRTTWLILLLISPALLLATFFYVGEVSWGRVSMAALPRLSFMAFVGIYYGAAIALVALRELLARTRARRWAAAVPWVFLALVFLLNNVDASRA
jgi:hypothetical protein